MAAPVHSSRRPRTLPPERMGRTFTSCPDPARSAETNAALADTTAVTGPPASRTALLPGCSADAYSSVFRGIGRSMSVEATPDRSGNSPAANQGALFAQLYDHLQRLARKQLGQSPRTSLDTCALVHEAYIKLDGVSAAGGQGEFLALAAKAMRHVLVDHIRARMTDKRGGDFARVALTTRLPDTEDRFSDLLEVDSGLAALERLEPRLVTVVECRFFGGMEFQEIAGALGISERTAQRDWRRARAFLHSHLSDDA